MKKLLFIATALLFPLLNLAQTSIKGTVKDQNTAAAIPLASVYITDEDQKKIVIKQTDKTGNYVIRLPSSFKSGSLSVTSLGYIKYSKEITAHSLPEILNIMLIQDQNQLKEVIVDTRKNAITIKGEKPIFDVDASGIGNGNNGLETVARVPGMRLDKDENLVYHGNKDIQVMINGRKSLLSGDALREYIRSLRGSDLKSIEIIAQPSSRYEAAGTAGIVNIVLKKSNATGLSGSINTATYKGDYFKSRQGGRLFYNDSLWTLTANGSYYNGKSVNYRHIKQNITLEGTEKIIDQYNTWLPVTKSSSLNFAVERKINKNQILSTEWQYYNEIGKETTSGYTNEYLGNTLQNRVDLSQFFIVPEKRVSGNLFYNFTSDSLTTKLDVQANFLQFSQEKNGAQLNDYADGTFMKLAGENKTSYTIANLQIDFRHKLSKKINFETGAKYSYVKMDYYNRYTTNNTKLLFIPDSLLVNDFKYDEKLVSGYAQASGEFGRWNMQAGIRVEHYNFVASSQINSKENKGVYTNLFPSFSFGYKQENNQYKFSYSKRIGRPNYLSLNPYYEYIDAYTLNIGNPALKPQYYDSFELSYIYKSKLNLSLYGYLYKDGFIKVIDYQRGQNYNITYDANAAKGSRFGFSASMPFQPAEWWTMQLSLDSYLIGEKSEIKNFSYSGTGFGYDLNFYQTADLKKGWKITMNCFYNGRSTTPSGFSIATYDMSLTGKKSLLDKKLIVEGGCTNLLKKSFYNETTRVNNVSTDWTNRWETRNFYMQLTYYFGSGKNKEVKATSLKEETKRM
ncbi:TonB-dependent receptor [Flavobacterium collinsii]|uniref:outer membrane beta-barrel family protein n=1 Tax=Flavobacterium collinsii TaxID=1114861 RepID=UPI0022C1F41D|nr:outer membrane beta-barrel family protein [Flavobacterium collinsii]GIQ59584.1 TonB-dependent receptor [Flavobacterium collinsii]